jgi:signal transduction histidine kinase
MTVRLRDIYKDLANQVNERSRQLVRSERMVSVGYLAAGVAHEINNPLQSISLYSDALESRLAALTQRVPPEQTAEISNFLRIIQQEAFRCKDITKKLLDFSRPGEHRRERTDLGKLIEDVIQVARPLPGTRGKRIEFSTKHVMASVSPPDLKSVVLNLIVNALDSMDEGGVLAVALDVRDEQAVLSFRDTGCGMTAEVLHNIFEPFFTRNRTGNGTGLGLSISHQIIDAHGGTITAASAGPGQGSTFTVTVPLNAAAASEAPDVIPLPSLQARRAA